MIKNASSLLHMQNLVIVFFPKHLSDVHLCCKSESRIHAHDYWNFLAVYLLVCRYDVAFISVNNRYLLFMKLIIVALVNY